MPPPWLLDPFTVVDGGLSTALEALGHRSSGLLWTAQLVLDDPDTVVAAHRSFVEAGADVVISSSYQASVAGFERAGASPADARRALASTTGLARRAGARFVAASVGPFGATLGDGSEYHGRYAASWADVRRFHRERIAVLADSAPDLFAVETIPSRAEAEIVVEELDALVAPGGPRAWVSFSCADATRSCAGDDLAEAVTAVAAADAVAAVGVNCTDPAFVSGLLQRARAATDLPLVAYPNHGRTWDAAGECWVGDGDGELDVHVADWLAAGARLIGGCCGIGAAGVARLAAARAAVA